MYIFIYNFKGTNRFSYEKYRSNMAWYKLQVLAWINTMLEKQIRELFRS
jgi:hypothetical protein